jgi:hypothetical protein
MRRYRITFTRGTNTIPEVKTHYGRNCQHAFRCVMKQYPDHNFDTLRGELVS